MRDFCVSPRIARKFHGPAFVADRGPWPDAACCGWRTTRGRPARWEAQGRYPGRKSTLVGLSSGAHSELALANSSTPIDAVVLQAGISDSLAPYCFEAPAATETLRDSQITPLRNYSPTRSIIGTEIEMETQATYRSCRWKGQRCPPHTPTRRRV